jgi:2-dehydro-3-deoxyphosphogluconate aldolase/(4S)-4-hydroxy-2-oxoglutarate aldolase
MLKTVDDLMRLGPVIPVLVIDRIEDAVRIAEVLVAGGVRAIEVTLRTPAALEAIAAMRTVEGAVVGAGTVLNEGQLRAAVDAGSEFIVSPGLTDTLARAALETELPFLPGVSSASDIMRGLDFGMTRFKFFPAEASGGIPALKALAAPFGQCRFCPTGGITEQSAPEWLALRFVECVGGSWLTPAGPVDGDAITRRARATAKLRITT